MSDPIVRPLTFEDLNEALGLSSSAGWNQRLDDWRMLLRLAPAGAFAAVIDARIVGTAIGVDYGSFGWIAMMLVDPAFRGRGVGRRLLEASMDAVPPNLPIRLDATPLGRPLYQKYGFEDEAMLSRYVAHHSNDDAAPASKTQAYRHDVRPLTPSDLETIIERDREIFGGTRGVVLDWALDGAAHYARVVQSPDGLTHYCFGRRGRLFDQIGPVVAGDDDIAQALLGAAFAGAGNRRVAVDAFDARAAFTAGLGLRGFAIERPLFRMCRRAGTRSRGTCVSHPSALSEFAILGPEFA